MGFHDHFPIDISSEIQSYITDDVMDWSRYLFTHREGRRQYGFCTHCKQEHLTEGLKHGVSVECPHCRSAVRVKASGRGRKAMVDSVYLLWYEKSLIDPMAIVARGFYAVRDYTKDYRKTETLIKPVALYLFEWGKSGLMARRNCWGGSVKWVHCKKVYSEAVRSMKYTPSYYSAASIKSAVRGTPFQYCTWEKYKKADFVEVFDLAARYPCIEFLTKYGLGHLVTSKLEGQATYSAINWRGKTPEKVLRLSKSDMKAMKASKVSVGALTLRCFQLSRKDGSNYTWEEASTMSDLLSDYNASELLNLGIHAPILVIKRYFLKQIKRVKSRYRSGGDVLISWRDYLRECRELGKDLTKEAVLFPNDLHRAHQESSQKTKLKRDSEVIKGILQRAAELQPYHFEHEGLSLRPCATNEELFAEGKTLKHCVGGYAPKYARGACDIFLIRLIDSPDAPFYTMEVIDGKVIQCRGFGNKGMTPAVREFVDAFIEKN